MDSSTEQGPSAHALRRLTIAVWALVAVLIVNATLQVVTQFLPFMYARQILAGREGTSSHRGVTSQDPLADFNEWPIEKKIQSASAIVATKYIPDGPRLKSTIAEILKADPDSTFNYRVGDEYAPSTRYVRENATYGDGEVIFFTGSPATMRYSSTYQGGRLLGLGDMPIDVLRQIIARQRGAPSK